MTDMTARLDSLRALHDAVKAGKYDRKGSVPRYYDFGGDSEGILPGTRMDRMSVLLGGKDAAVEHLAALIAEAEDRAGKGLHGRRGCRSGDRAGKPAGVSGAAEMEGVMPIRDENKARYPRNWPTISQQVRERAGQKCEKCGAPNGELIRRGKTADGQHVWRLCSDSAFMDGVCAETGLLVPNSMEDEVGYGAGVKVILTVAHLDHQPENCAPENLRAWCQRCHNVYDAPMRRAGTKARKRSSLAAGDLFP